MFIIGGLSGLSPFKCSMGYHPPLFPEQEEEVNIPLIQMFVLEKTLVGSSLNHLQGSSISRSPPDSGSLVSSREEGMAVYTGPALPGGVP